VRAHIEPAKAEPVQALDWVSGSILKKAGDALPSMRRLAIEKWAVVYLGQAISRQNCESRAPR